MFIFFGGVGKLVLLQGFIAGVPDTGQKILSVLLLLANGSVIIIGNKIIGGVMKSLKSRTRPNHRCQQHRG
jgi:hypothetical protein